jgi:hypothetical protein
MSSARKMVFSMAVTLPHHPSFSNNNAHFISREKFGTKLNTDPADNGNAF